MAEVYCLYRVKIKLQDMKNHKKEYNYSRKKEVLSMSLTHAQKNRILIFNRRTERTLYLSKIGWHDRR